MTIKIVSKLIDQSNNHVIYEGNNTLQEGDNIPCLVEVPNITQDRTTFEPGIAKILDSDTLTVSTVDGKNVSTFKENQINEAQGISYIGFRAVAMLPFQEKLKATSLGFLGKQIERSAKVIWEPSSSKERE